jgi:hypothetical protein
VEVRMRLRHRASIDNKANNMLWKMVILFFIDLTLEREENEKYV